MITSDWVLICIAIGLACFFAGGYLALHLTKDLVQDYQKNLKMANERADRAMAHRMEADTRLEELEAKGLLRVEKVIDVVRRNK